MKCDELKPLVFSINDLAYVDELAVRKNFDNPHDHAVYKATEVDKAIAELKAKLENVQASTYADSVDAGMRERRLRRALYKACANWAHAEFLWARFIDFKFPETWYEMEDKCLKKAEEYR